MSRDSLAATIMAAATPRDDRTVSATPPVDEPRLGLRARGVPLVERADGRDEIDRVTRRVPYDNPAPPVDEEGV